MRLNKLTDYAVLAMIALAKSSTDGRSFPARTLADLTNVPLPTMAKILKLLSQADLVNSTRGISGGYCLSRKASQISVAHILEAIEGQVALTECVTGTDGDCSVQSMCWMRGRWDTVNTAVSQALSKISLVEMMPKPFAFEPNYEQRLNASQAESGS